MDTENKEQKNTKMPKNKKNAIIFLCATLALLIILPILTFVDWNAIFPKKEDNSDRDSWIKFYGDQYFGAPNYDTNIKDDTKYMQLDRLIYYTLDGHETFSIDDDPSKYGSTCKLFYDYFELVKAGEYESYYSLFTESYAKKHGNTNFFTKKELVFSPQKIYNIKVSLIRSAYLENGDKDGKYVGSTVYYFDVSYCIKDNDGTFRRDILSDESRPLVFELLETNGEIKISDIAFYKQQETN